MVIALEIAFAAGLAVVGISLVAVVTERAGDRFLLWATIALGVAAVVGAVALGINLVSSFTETDALLLVVGGLCAAAVAEAGLLALSRGLRRIRQVDELADS